MGSGVGAVQETAEVLRDAGEKVGVLEVRLFRPFATQAFVDALPPTVKAVAVLDRTKEPGAPGEPLYQDVVTSLVEAVAARRREAMPVVVGGRYGLASKEFDPAMARGVFDELRKDQPKRGFTVGIVDDVTHTSLDVDPSFTTEADDVVRAVFYGLGADGTVSANKSSVKIIGDSTDLYAQGYFVYDSKKSGTMTTSHVRFGPRPIRSSYLISRANFVACHQFGFLERTDVLDVAEPGATFLLNSPYGPDDVWDHLPIETQRHLVDKHLTFYVVDAQKVANEVGLGARINTVLQTCFFALSGVLPRDEAIAKIKAAIEKSYGKRGQSVLDMNFAAVDRALEGLHQVTVPSAVTATTEILPPVPDGAPDFVKRVTATMIAGHGDRLPVSALPVDGTFPTATTQWEKRSIALEIPVWDPQICIDCAKCAIVCPHAAILMKVFEPSALDGAPGTFKHREWKDRDHPGLRMTIQVAPDDCTGCGVCVDICPAKSKEVVKHKSIDMEPKLPHLEEERANYAFFERIPTPERREVKLDTIKGSQQIQPLFEFSGACAGCGETPYLKLLTQLFGDRMVVANATGCSSIYGGNLPSTPWSRDRFGRGPAWANSLFEDNAEFGLGMRVALDHEAAYARELVGRMRDDVGAGLAGAILDADQSSEDGIAAQRERVAELKATLETLDTDDARALLGIADGLVRKSVWIVGGDGWAYDIGFGGLDHVLASDRNVKVLVLDTEVYSNTGGQASKATPRGAVAKFAAAGKAVGKKDLGMLAADYGNVYVAHVALGADNMQTIKAFLDAEAYDGPALIIAYSTCIEHGIDMATSMSHQLEAVRSGYWPLYRYDPRHAATGDRPFHLDSKKPTIPLREFESKEARFAMLQRSRPEDAERLLELAQEDVDERWHFYEQLAGVERVAPGEMATNGDAPSGNGHRPGEVPS